MVFQIRHVLGDFLPGIPHHGGFTALRNDLDAAIQSCVVNGQGIADVQIDTVDFGADGYITSLVFLRAATTGFVEIITISQSQHFCAADVANLEISVKRLGNGEFFLAGITRDQ